VLYVATRYRVYALGQCPDDTCDDGMALAGFNETVPVPSGMPPRAPSGYTIYPGCRRSTTAIVTTVGEPLKATGDAVIAAAGPIKTNGGYVGGGCIDANAAIIRVNTAADAVEASVRFGEWLVKSHQRGEVDVVVEPAHVY
jgi:hypothetical protein